MVNNQTIPKFKQLQQGSWGIFIGFPDNQAGWLIYVENKINNSHLVRSMDVVFDQYLLLGIGLNKFGFAGSEPHRALGQTGRIANQSGEKLVISPI